MADVVVTQNGGLTIATFDPAQLGIVVSPRPDGNVYPLSGSSVTAQHPDVVAALDGPMFEVCDGQPYSRSQCADLDYEHFDARSGISYASDPDKISRGIAFSVLSDGSVAVSIGGSRPSEATVSVQLYPTLVYDGAVQSVSTSGSNTSIVWRAALALMSDGKLAFIVGRYTLPGFAEALSEIGVVAAGYTDGGGSALLLADGNAFGSSEGRRVASWLVARKRSSVASNVSSLPLFFGIGMILTAGALAHERSREKIWSMATAAKRAVFRIR